MRLKNIINLHVYVTSKTQKPPHQILSFASLVNFPPTKDTISILVAMATGAGIKLGGKKRENDSF